MLLFSTDEKVVYAQDAQTEIRRPCKCGKQGQQVTVVKYLTFMSLPLVLFRRLLAYKCYGCFRLTITEMKQSCVAKLETRLPLLAGWLVLVALLGAVLFSYKLIFPDDIDIRTNPKVGDLYILNLYNLKGKSEHFYHPFALAKVSSIEDTNVLTLEISKWHYQKELAVIKDFLLRKEQFFSYYSSNPIKIGRNQVLNSSVVKSARRRVNLVDVEEIHKITRLETEVQAYPSAH